MLLRSICIEHKDGLKKILLHKCQMLFLLAGLNSTASLINLVIPIDQ